MRRAYFLFERVLILAVCVLAILAFCHILKTGQPTREVQTIERPSK